MSALGHKQTCAAQNAMSALHLIATAKADIDCHDQKPPKKAVCWVMVRVTTKRRSLSAWIEANIILPDVVAEPMAAAWGGYAAPPILRSLVNLWASWMPMEARAVEAVAARARARAVRQRRERLRRGHGGL
jgi:hypothetical protein